MARTMLIRPRSIVILLSSLFIAGCGDDKPASTNKEAPRVTVVHPVTRPLTDEETYNGWLEAFKTVDVVARVRGYITKVNFKDGDLVTEDKTPLFEIDDAPFKAELARTKAQAAALQAQEVAAKALAEKNKKLLETHAGLRAARMGRIGSEREVLCGGRSWPERRSG